MAAIREHLHEVSDPAVVVIPAADAALTGRVATLEAAPTTVTLAAGMVITGVATALADGDVTTLPASSLVLTSHATGRGILFISDGAHIQAVALA